MLGYDRIEITIATEPSFIPGQWSWKVDVYGWSPLRCFVAHAAKGIEGSKANATEAAILAREEIWELLR